MAYSGLACRKNKARKTFKVIKPRVKNTPVAEPNLEENYNLGEQRLQETLIHSDDQKITYPLLNPKIHYRISNK
jgi:hypothetical protein